MSPAGSSVTPATYTFRVRILGGVYAPTDGRQIWRELELTGEHTLGDLGEAIPLAFGFDDLHLWSFFLSGKPWDDATEYALSPSPDPAGGRRARPADRLRIRDAPPARSSCSCSTTAMNGTSASGWYAPARRPSPLSD